MFHRQHYIYIAGVLRGLRMERILHSGMHQGPAGGRASAHLRGQVDGVEQAVDALADLFEDLNPRFDRDKFYSAVGMDV